MKKINTLMLVMSVAMISACASNEVEMETEGARGNTEMAKEEASAAAESAKTEMQAMEAEATAASSAEATESAPATSDDSGNLVSTCTHGDNTRIITVVYDNDATDTVCEVTYEKASGIQTLWTANNDRDYCSARAAEFVQKQEGWGWNCSPLQ